MNPICSRNKPGSPLLFTGSLKISGTRDKIEPRITTRDKSEVTKFMNNTNESMAPGPRATQDFQGQMDVFAQPGLESALFPRWLLIPPFTSAFPTLSYCSLLFPWLLDPNVSIGLFPFYRRLHLHVSATFTGSLHEETMSPQTSCTYFQCCLRKN